MGLPPLDLLTAGPADHVCHAFDGPVDLARTAPAYLDAGLELGQRAFVVAPAAEFDLAQELAAAADGPVQVVALGATAGHIDVAAGLTRLAAALDDAVSVGHTGLRMVGLLTALALDPAAWASFAEWEHVVGRWQSTRPIATSCCLDRSQLGDKTVHEVACLHPRVVTAGPAVPFRLYHAAGRLVLEGELDTFCTPLLARALALVAPEPGRRLVVDARGLTFVNHRAVLAMVEGLAGRHPAGVTLAGAPSVSPRLLDSLRIDPRQLDALPSPW